MPDLIYLMNLQAYLQLHVDLQIDSDWLLLAGEADLLLNAKLIDLSGDVDEC